MNPFEIIPSTEGRSVVGIAPSSFASLRPHPSEEKEKQEHSSRVGGEVGRAVYDVFLPGPLYFHALLDRSLVEGFRAAADKQEDPVWRELPIQYAVWKFRRPLIANCGEWSNLICIMDRRSFVYFKQWLAGINFVDRARRLVFLNAFEQAAILDPFLLDGRNQIVAERVTVLCPICKEWHAKPSTYAGIEKSSAPAKVELVFEKPLPEMLKTLEQLAEELKV